MESSISAISHAALLILQISSARLDLPDNGSTKEAEEGIPNYRCVCVLVHRLHTALNERKRTETKTFTNTTGITVNSTENNTQTPCTTQ